jgi:hypothetical protein
VCFNVKTPPRRGFVFFMNSKGNTHRYFRLM